MKTHRFPFPIRSKFLAPCTASIRSHRLELLAGKTLRIQLEKGGYTRQRIATIDPNDAKYFHVDEEHEEGRLSARLRAAALALYNESLFGKFELTHDDGLLTIRSVNLLKRSSN